MDLNVFDPNNTLRRVFSFAAALPTNSTLSSLNAAMQTLKEGGSGLQWMAGTASSAFVFANRNVVIPLLRAATPPIGIVSGVDSRHRAADPAVDAEQLQFAQTRRRRRGAAFQLQQQQSQPRTKRGGKSKKGNSRIAAAAPVQVAGPSAGLYSLSLSGEQFGVSLVDHDEEQQHEAVQLLHMGLQSSLL